MRSQILNKTIQAKQCSSKDQKTKPKLSGSESVESMDIETDSIVANLMCLCARTFMKQDRLQNICLWSKII